MFLSDGMLEWLTRHIDANISTLVLKSVVLAKIGVDNVQSFPMLKGSEQWHLIRKTPSIHVGVPCKAFNIFAPFLTFFAPF